MKRGARAPVVGGTVSVLGALVWLTFHRAPVGHAIDPPADAATHNVARAQAPDADGPPPAGAAVATPHRVAVHPFPRLPRTRTGLPLADDPFTADTVEEQRWLDRNGYPNAQQWRTYTGATDAELEQAADAGDGVAKVMLDARRLAQGDPGAEASLMTAGANGSQFALKMLAAYMAGSKHGDPVRAQSLRRVLQFRGDWRSGFLVDGESLQALDSLQRLQADAEALRMFRDMRRQSRRATFVDPRPIGP